ncbi:hypothetical protein F5Y10DRAFT_261056 [Nemania abortiva]|nr:hypothetical protein F5Y10DRAFT_261056 [Nemania abortiva]
MPEKTLEIFSKPEDAQVDIVFVPGLAETMRQAWAGSQQKKPLWPQELLGIDIPSARIIAYEYDASIDVADYVEHANDFCRRLSVLRNNTRTTERPIVLVTHSLGGIVFAQLLGKGDGIIEKSPFKDLSKHIRGLAFFGTPFQNSGDLSLVERVGKIACLFEIPIQALVNASQLLSSFSEVLAKRAEEKREIRVVSFYEGCDTCLSTGRNGEQNTLVDQTAATIPNHGSVLAIEGDHFGICTFKSKDDEYYKKVVQELRNLAQVEGHNKASTGNGIYNYGTWIEGNVTGGKHDNNQGQINYGTISNQNIGVRQGNQGGEKERDPARPKKENPKKGKASQFLQGIFK